MQDELTTQTGRTAKKTIVVALAGAELTAALLAAAFRKITGKAKGTAKTGADATVKTGEKKIKELIGSGDGVSSVEITNQNIGSFRQTARKYGIDFSLMRDKNEDPPKWMVFFKGKDTDVMHAAFKEYSNKVLKKEQQKEKRAEKSGIAEKMKEARRRTKEAAMEKKEKNLNRGAGER